MLLSQEPPRNTGSTSQSSNEMAAHFLSAGGTVGEILEMVLAVTFDQDEITGIGLLQKDLVDEVEALPECRNDREFDMIKALLCK